MAVTEAGARAAIESYVEPYLQRSLGEAAALRAIELRAGGVLSTDLRPERVRLRRLDRRVRRAPPVRELPRGSDLRRRRHVERLRLTSRSPSLRGPAGRQPGTHCPFWQISPVSQSALPPGHALRGTLIVHCAMWLPLPMSWKGSQKAGKLGSCPRSALAGSKATIQSCVSWPAGRRRP